MAIKEKLVGSVGVASGITSTLGSYQVCHSLCMTVIALLGILGITVAGMPLMFLTKVAIPFWIAAVIMLGILGYFHIKMKCVSGKLLMFNSGLIIAGVPFAPINQYPVVLWSVGGILVITSIVLYIKGKYGKKKK
ncbi:MAG TPA: hypothetical protein VI612_04955 [Candidatus Nanoarchaeia archaeon]|nr:hypothetical protein [Candidatus Nanoarchaeia archaeon]